MSPRHSRRLRGASGAEIARDLDCVPACDTWRSDLKLWNTGRTKRRRITANQQTKLDIDQTRRSEHNTCSRCSGFPELRGRNR
jgi:hypothetical protein